MIAFDTHVHTEYSTDSDTRLTDQIRSAEKIGLNGICITDHMDYDFPPEAIKRPVDVAPFCFDIDTYQKHLREERSSTGFQLLCGVECGLQTTKSVIDKNERLVSDKGWDYIIGSLHLVNRADPYYPSFWEDRDPVVCIQEYFDEMLENVQHFSSFDSLGHMDYIVRYAPSSYQYEPRQFMEQIDAILQILIKKDIALEVNTSGWKVEGRCQNPHLEILKHYVSLGGELLTIGSDAHIPEYLAYRFTDLSELIKKAGLRQYCVYKKRKPVFYDL